MTIRKHISEGPGTETTLNSKIAVMKYQRKEIYSCGILRPSEMCFSMIVNHRLRPQNREYLLNIIKYYVLYIYTTHTHTDI